jgi:hypothetical protein
MITLSPTDWARSAEPVAVVHDDVPTLLVFTGPVDWTDDHLRDAVDAVRAAATAIGFANLTVMVVRQDTDVSCHRCADHVFTEAPL